MSDISTKNTGNITTGDITDNTGVQIAVGQGIIQAQHNYYGEDKYNVRGLDNPYLGLAAFNYDKRDLYAGREQDIAQAVKLLTAPGEQRPVLFITGASGSGKSSFAQAGLIPALEQHYGNKFLHWAVFRPSRYPIDSLFDALQRQVNLPVHTLDRNRLPQSLYSFLRQCTSPPHVFTLIIDQFEELFSQSDHLQRDQLFAILTNLPPFAELRAHLITTVRADYLPELFAHEALYDQAKHGIDLRVMCEDKLKQAIQRPLRQTYPNAHKHFEDELLDRLAYDAAGDAAYLPLLQATLERLWSGGILKLGAYNSLADAIQQQAEDVYTNNPDDTPRPEASQQAILSLLLELVDVSPLDNDLRDVRRRRTLIELLHTAPERRSLVKELADARLLSTGRETRADKEVEVVDIIHESLLSNWTRLRDAINTKRETLQQRARFEIVLQEWQENAGNDAYLLAGHRLVAAEELAALGDVVLRNSVAQEFLKLSVMKRETERKRQLRRVQMIAGVLAVLLVLAVGAGWVAFYQQQVAEQEKERAEQQAAIATSRQFAAQAGSRIGTGSGDTTLLLGVQAMTIAPTVEARSSLLNILRTISVNVYLHGGYINKADGMAFSPDGHTLASGSGGDNSVILWDVATGQARTKLEGHTERVTSVAFSPDGHTLASGSGDNSVILWDVATVQARTKLEGHTGEVTSVAFSPDGQTLASSNRSGTVILWDVATGQARTKLEGHPNSVTSVAFSLDGQTLASGTVGTIGTGGTIILWDVKTSEPRIILEGHTHNVTSVAFSPDGHTLASGGCGHISVYSCVAGEIILWDVATGQSRTRLEGHTGEVTSVAFSPDGQTLASSSGASAVLSNEDIILWDVATGQSRITLNDLPSLSVVFSPDGHTLASGSMDGTIILWNIMATSNIGEPFYCHLVPSARMIFSPDGQFLASGSMDGSIILWNLADGQPCTTFEGHTVRVTSVAFSPDGHTLASGSDDNTSILWDIATGQARITLEGHTDRVISIAFSPDGHILATTSLDGTTILWGFESGEVLEKLHLGNTSSYKEIAFSPDGKTLLLFDYMDDTLILWDLVTEQQLVQPLGSHVGDIISVTFSPNKQILASSIRQMAFLGQVSLWNIATDEQIGDWFIGHDRVVGDMEFTPDGQFLATNGGETIILWDVATGQQIDEFQGGNMVFSLDGQTLAYVSMEDTIILRAAPQEPQEHACKIANRNLTWEEWQRYLLDRPYEKTCPNLPPHPSAVEAGVVK